MQSYPIDLTANSNRYKMVKDMYNIRKIDPLRRRTKKTFDTLSAFLTDGGGIGLSGGMEFSKVMKSTRFGLRGRL